MASRFWVGGTGNWTDTTHWSTTSGGAGGAALPTSGDDCFWDANSGGGTITMSGALTCRNLDATGFTGTLAQGAASLTCSGTVFTLGSSMSGTGMTNTTGTVLFNLASGTVLVRCNGKSISGVNINNSGTIFSQQDALTTNTTFTLTQGTHKTNNFNFTIGSTYSCVGSSGKIFDWGSSSGTAVTYTFVSTGVTISTNTATLTMTGTGTFTGSTLAFFGTTVVLTSSTSVTWSNSGGAVANLTVNGPTIISLGSGMVVTGTLTLTGADASLNRLLVQSNTYGTPRNISAVTVVATNVNFRDITVAKYVEDFNTADSATVGRLLTCTSITGDLKNASSEVQVTNAAVLGLNRVEVDLPSSDHWTQVPVTLGTPSSSACMGGPTARANATNGDCYVFYASRDSSATVTFVLAKYVSGTLTTITTTVAPFINGDTLRLAVSGTTLTGYQNGTQVIQTTDSSITTGTRGGFTLRAGTSATRASTFIDTWQAGGWDLSSITGGSGDELGNSDIVFTAPTTQTHTGATSTWSDVTKWTSRVPLPQDNVAFSGGSGNVTADMTRLGANIDFTNYSGLFSAGGSVVVLGSVTLAPGMTFGGAGSFVLRGRGSHTITSNGKSISQQWLMDCLTGTYTLNDAISTTRANGGALTFTSGTFNAVSYNVTEAATTGNASITLNGATVNMGSGTWFVNSQSITTVWNFTSGLFDAQTSTISIALDNGGAGRTFVGGGQIYNIVNIPVGGNSPANAVTITGNNTFAQLNVSQSGAVGGLFRFAAGSTQTIQQWNVNGTNFGYQRMTNSNSQYISAPDSAALSITGDLDLRIRVEMDVWTNGGTRTLIGKANAGAGQFSFTWNISSTQTYTLNLSADGTTVVSTAALPTAGFAANSLNWLRVTWRQSDGRVQMFKADGSLTNPSSSDWVQVGTNQTLSVASIFDGTSGLEIGSNSLGSTGNLVSSSLYRAQVLNGIDGTVALDADFTTKTVGANSFTESSANAATVTITGANLQLGDGRISVTSNTAGTAATIKPVVSSSVPFVSNYLSVKDMTAQDPSGASGTGDWYATNSADNGNNTGWVFAARPGGVWGLTL